VVWIAGRNVVVKIYVMKARVKQRLQEGVTDGIWLSPEMVKMAGQVIEVSYDPRGHINTKNGEHTYLWHKTWLEFPVQMRVRSDIMDTTGCKEVVGHLVKYRQAGAIKQFWDNGDHYEDIEYGLRWCRNWLEPVENAKFKVGDKVIVKGSKWVPDGEYVVVQVDQFYSPDYSGAAVDVGGGEMMRIEKHCIRHKDKPETIQVEKSKILELARDEKNRDVLKALFPDVIRDEPPLLPNDWKIEHPNGHTFLESTAHDGMEHNHILLNSWAFEYEIIDKPWGRSYLKVTPK